MEYNLYIAYGDQILQHTASLDGLNIYEIELRPFGINTTIILELWGDKWTFISRGALQFYRIQRTQQASKLVPVTSIELTADTLIHATAEKQPIQIAVQPANDDLYILNKYRVQENVTLVAGSDTSCAFVCNTKLMRPKHFSLHYAQGVWTLQTAQNSYVWVNGVKTTGTHTLSLYDTVSCYNLRVCCMNNICAVNRAAKVRLQPVNQLDMLQATSATVTTTDEFYLRTPRMLRVVDTEKLIADTPPAPKIEDKTPWLLSIGPSMTMMLPMMAAMLINMNINSGRGASITSYVGICVSMGMSALMNLGWAIGRRKWQKKQDKKNEAERQTRYHKYLEDLRTELIERETSNRDVLAAEYLLTAVYTAMLEQEDDPHLWTMNVHHNDYGTVRVGTGTVKNLIPFDVPKERFTMQDDDLRDELTALYEEHEYVTDMPVVYNLRNSPAVGVVGTPEFVAGFARSMLVQIAHTYSYVDVKIGMCADTVIPEMLDSRFIPHTMTADGNRRLFAYTDDTLERLVSWLANVITERTTAFEGKNDIPVITPFIVVFCYTRHILDYDAIRQYIDSGLVLGVVFVLLFGKLALMPNGCQYIIENDENFKGSYAVADVPDTDTNVAFDTLDEETLASYSKRLGRFAVQEAAAGILPSSIDFLSLLEIGNLAKFDLRQSYRKHDTSKNIRGLLGMGHNGVAWLDIHEKQAGPHGLVAGMTGSGKSELLQTLILSWALCYSPDELAFVLIDYKGGGMANIFANLPHTAGVITNLSEEVEEDDASADNTAQGSMQRVLTVRALTSIKAEVKHRQAVFKAYGVNHIDAYIQLYKHGQATEPLPHLIIIVDEFAELRKEQHDFISDLVSAARVGRSLGVHLILATQKPAGVVDDEIWSNSRFRACLRVQDKQDSMGMLHRPEAAFLTQIGRMYLQVGVDEIFEEIQCAYTGADYVPTDDGNVVDVQICEMVQLDGATIQYKPRKVENTETQLDACIEFIAKSCEKYAIASARKLWLPVLPRKLTLAEIPYKTSSDDICVALGLIDDVVRQQQAVLVQSVFTMSNLAIVGNQGCGKTTMLQTMLYGLAMNYTPEDVCFYICDYSSGGLKAFETLPHCGGVLNDAYTSGEQVMRLLRMLKDMCEERRQLFDTVGVSNHVAYCKISKIPVILFIIDNFMQWAQVHENLQTQLLQLLRESPKYGIQTIVTVNAGNELKYNLRPYIQAYYTLTLPDNASYREFTGATPTTLPPHYKGRGICMCGGALSEYQVAVPLLAENEALRNYAVREKLVERADLLRTTSTACAKSIPSIPYGADYKTLLATHKLLTAQAAKEQRLFIGYNTDTLEPMYIDLIQTYNYVVSDFIDGMPATQHFIENLLYVSTAYKYKQIILNPDNRIVLKHTNTVMEYNNAEQVLDALLMLNDLFVVRTTNERPAFLQSGGTVDDYQRSKTPYIVYIPDISAFVAMLQSKEMDATQTARFRRVDDIVAVVANMLQKGNGYGVHFILGCNSDVHKNVYSDKVRETAMMTKTFVHFGGALQDIKFRNCTPHLSMSKMAQTTDDITKAYTMIKNVDTSLWVP